ncbi:unnamed protein product [Sphagnum troendelagicum]|uniref:Uncharacterized protein n=1 Tax=Sphagnum troendelagicum TaxID=128251 RepID=A0ABP0TF13_9BRYO
MRMRQRAQCLGASEDELGVQKLVKLDAAHTCDNGAWEAEKSACTQGADESDDRDYEVPTRLPDTALLLGA